MASITELRQALIETLREAFPGVTVGRAPAVTPCMVVGWPDLSTVRASFGATGLWGSPDDPGLVFPVVVHLAASVAEEAAETLEGYLNDSGQRSIAEAVEASGTALAAVAEAVEWEASRQLETESVPDFEVVAGEVSVRVIARRG